MILAVNDRRQPLDTGVTPRAGGMNAAEIQRYARKREQSLQTLEVERARKVQR